MLKYVNYIRNDHMTCESTTKSVAQWYHGVAMQQFILVIMLL